MKDRYVNGYKLVYKPNHFTSMNGGNWDGYIYEHRYVIELFIGRYLEEDEVVHHKDMNRANNSVDNLAVMKRSEHSSHHNKKCVKKECINCGIAFHPSKNKQKYCSRACFDSHRETIDWPSLLELESMVAKNGYSKSGRILGVSNNAIKKRIEKIKSR